MCKLKKLNLIKELKKRLDLGAITLKEYYKALKDLVEEK